MYLSEKLADLPGISIPYIAPRMEHAFHIFAMRYDEQVVCLPRGVFIKALQAEGIPCSGGYPRPLYENPIFQEKIAYGLKGCPFSCSFYGKKVDYRHQPCPVAEDLCQHTALWIAVVRPPATVADMDDIVNAIKKVYERRKDLQ